MTVLEQSQAAERIDAGTEFDRQLQALLAKGYPALAGVSEQEFVRMVAPLRVTATRRGDVAPATRARVPFVLVVSAAIVPAERSMPLTVLNGRPGFVDRTAADIARFRPIAELDIPPGPAYILFDIDRGAETLNVRPDDALVTISARGRTPLTVDDGIALITQFPDVLEKNNCFSLVGSRCGDRRVPALWISAKAAKLGWCWAGNPHTWLGSASCAARAGAPIADSEHIGESGAHSRRSSTPRS